MGIHKGIIERDPKSSKSLLFENILDLAVSLKVDHVIQTQKCFEQALLVVLSRFKLKKKKSQDQEEENRLCLSKLKCLELNPRTPGQIVETLQTICMNCTA